MPSQPPTAKEIFVELIGSVPADQWEQRLPGLCQGDEDLLRRVNALLKAHADPSSFLDAPLSAVAIDPGPTTAGTAAERPGTQIGPYKLLQVIGEGGMGVVYMAEQKEPVERRVALKIIKPGMDSRQVIARFEAERQALAMMDHPNIARVLDAGTTESGRPYFVMELVKGVPITKYCDEKHLSLKERLELMIPVCQAIQHAHQKGIIHRDIKPTNVLVAQYDGKPVPKVIDFGVAKATAQKLTERTMFTELGQIVGTLEYMSPEQAELNQLDIDTRSDIYSLGVLLYELLTGSTPFDKQKLRTAAFHEMLRIIREDEPPKPSTNLSTTGALPSIAANRQTEPARLSKAVRGELDWIVMKALEKDRNRRYETANGFAADIQRYLSDETVQACPPSTAYRFSKFARRNKATLTTTAIVATALVIGTAVSVWQAVEANSARTLADERLVLADQRLTSERQARREAEDERRKAESERQRADSERQHAEANFRKALEAVDRMLTRVGDDSLRNIPQIEQVQKKILQDAVEFYQGFLAERSEDPQVRYETAKAYMRIVGFYSGAAQDVEFQKTIKAANELFRELHAQQPDDDQIVVDLAYSYTWLGWHAASPEASEGHFRRANELLISLVENRAPAAVSNEHRQALAQNYVNLAGVARSRRRFDESEQLLDRALALSAGKEDAYVLAMVYHKRALLLEDVGRISEAIDMMQQALQQRQQTMSQSSKWRTVELSDYAGSCHGLGAMLVRAKRTADALPHLQKALEIRERLAHDFPTVGKLQSDLADSRLALIRAYRELGRSADALQIVNQLNPRTGDEYVARGKLHEMLGDAEAALADYKKAIELEPSNSAAQPNLVSTLHSMGNISVTLGRYVEALLAYGQGLKLQPDNAGIYVSRGDVYYRQKDFANALGDYLKAVELQPDTADHYYRRGHAYYQLGQYNKALQDFKRALDLAPDSRLGFVRRGFLGTSVFANLPNDELRAGLISLADEMVERERRSTQALSARASILEGLGQFEAALEDLNETVKRGTASAYQRRGRLYISMKRFDRALADYEKALELEPNNTSILNNAAWFLATSAERTIWQPERAVELARRATTLDPSKSTYFNTLGTAEYRAGQWQAAIEHLLVRVHGNHASEYDWFFLAMAHWQLDHQGEARAWYDKAVAQMDKSRSDNDELRRFRAEASALMQVPLDGKQSTSKEADSQKKEP